MTIPDFDNALLLVAEMPVQGKESDILNDDCYRKYIHPLSSNLQQSTNALTYLCYFEIVHLRPATFIRSSLLSFRTASIPLIGILKPFGVFGLCGFRCSRLCILALFGLGRILLRIKRKHISRWIFLSRLQL